MNSIDKKSFEEEKKTEALAIKANLFPAFKHHQHQHITVPKLFWIFYTIEIFRKNRRQVLTI